MRPGAEAEEVPLILNPYVKEPSRHLSFSEVGEVIGLTDEGKVTIDRCGLDRKSLVLERERVARQLLRDLDDYVEALISDNPMAERHAPPAEASSPLRWRFDLWCRIPSCKRRAFSTLVISA